MQVLAVVVLAAVAVLTVSAEDVSQDQRLRVRRSVEVSPEEWKNYKLKYGKVYADPIEDAKRLALYTHTKERVTKHNEQYAQGKVTWTMGINKFADYTEEEMKQLHGLLPGGPHHHM